MIKSMLFLFVTLVIYEIAIARNLPQYDLDNISAQEIKNILSHHLQNKNAPIFGRPNEVRNWGLNLPVGQVTGVSVDPEGNPVLFHRGTRTWHQRSFNWTYHFLEDGPINEDVVLTLDSSNGEVIDSWGKGLFYLPHGITVDNQGNTWLTDVGLHQVFKFEKNSKTPSLTLGQHLIPGSDKTHFCQPTSVAVASSGEFFVSDGYCNSRIIKFSKEGEYVAQFGPDGISEAVGGLNIPHGMALNDVSDILCVADRENTRVICIRAGLQDPQEFGEPVTALKEPSKARVFDIAFIDGGLLGVAGSEEEGIALGFTADGETGKIVDEWSTYQGLRNPHSIAVSPDQSVIYVGEIKPNRIWKFEFENSRH